MRNGERPEQAAEKIFNCNKTFLSYGYYVKKVGIKLSWNP